MPRLGALALGFTWLAPKALASYDCGGVETIGEVQGQTGSICSPRCTGDSYTCPTDVPVGISAQPQCMLQDVNSVAYCGLLCTADTQCPSGASCKRVNDLGICIHPLSFKEWAGATSARTKLTVGYPAKAVQNSKSGSFKIAKAYAALQSMKRRFGMADGDADVLTVKELLQAASAQAVRSGPSGGGGTTVVGSMAAPPAPSSPSSPSSGSSQHLRDFEGAAFENDINYFLKNLANGPAGIEKEIADTEWKLEHLDQYGVCTDLLRGILLVVAIYVCGGSFYKYHTMGAAGMDMIPHIGFWMEYPSLVTDGFAYAMMLGSECLGGRPVPRSGGIGGMPGDRDTFANFEPSK